MSPEPPVADPSPAALAAAIDHTLLKADATAAQIRQLCAEAIEHRFHSVCVNPVWVDLASRELAATPVKVCTVAGFPLGATAPAIKAAEAADSIARGADEIDMVMQIGALKGCEHDYVREDIRRVAEVCRKHGALCKVIIEAALLEDAEKATACRLAVEAGADFVKTSTGFGPGGATVEDVALMAKAVAEDGLGVKAAGGIRTLDDARRMIRAGATRLGTSASVAIVGGGAAAKG
ncbi:MAG: deoxyribose-phosphate aldolase [Candidatus Krumholzibacteriota bacterium]|nr:deoxyribose-phosphate aldolase [Candidatus Krumholzibacteriota bacterium]